MGGTDRPKGCMGCGHQSAVDPDEPAPHETTFEVVDESDNDVAFECGTCRTLTRIPKDPEPTVECHNCGDEIPESLQGNHVCESHPLGKAAEPTFENPMEEHR